VIVAFLLVGEEQRPLAERMVASVKRHMRTVPIIHMRDQNTKPVKGSYSTQMLEWDGKYLMTYRLRHLAALPDPEVLILDTDTIVQADVRKIFYRSFDVALTKRDGPILDPNGIDIAKLMPFNTGVMFSKSRKFWHDCHEWCAAAPESIQNWWGDQLAVKAIAPKYRVLELPCDTYNYSPDTRDEDTTGRLILHYKGKRKQWMLDKWQSRTTRV
jgi:hypothetical protein